MGNDRTDRDDLRRSACKAHDFASARAALVRQLADQIKELGGRLATSTDIELFDVLLDLYDRSPDAVWSEVVGPWMDARLSKLQLVYAEHQALADDTQLLDQPHADVWGVRLLL